MILDFWPFGHMSKCPKKLLDIVQMPNGSIDDFGLFGPFGHNPKVQSPKVQK